MGTKERSRLGGLVNVALPLVNAVHVVDDVRGGGEAVGDQLPAQILKPGSIGLCGDDFGSLVEGLPGGPPRAFELDPFARQAREFADGDAEGAGEAHGDLEYRLLLVAFVPADLAQVNAGRAGEL